MSEETVNGHDEWIDRLSEVVDGTLEPGERHAAEAHLASCATCREIVADLRRVVAEARELGPVRPRRDLWPGIEAELDSGARVIALPVDDPGPSREGTRPRRRRSGLYLSVPQLAAAALVLVAATSLLTWSLSPAAPAAFPATGPAPASARLATAGSELDPPPELADELERLTRALDDVRAELDPNTVRILERNLAVVEEAIRDSQRALALDPGNPFLEEHLDRAWERKRSWLQEAAGIAEWARS